MFFVYQSGVYGLDTMYHFCNTNKLYNLNSIKSSLIRYTIIFINFISPVVLITFRLFHLLIACRIIEHNFRNNSIVYNMNTIGRI
jgi:hypothetical protein